MWMLTTPDLKAGDWNPLRFQDNGPTDSPIWVTSPANLHPHEPCYYESDRYSSSPHILHLPLNYIDFRILPCEEIFSSSPNIPPKPTRNVLMQRNVRILADPQPTTRAVEFLLDKSISGLLRFPLKKELQ